MKELEDFILSRRSEKTRKDYRRYFIKMFEYFNIKNFEDFKKLELADYFKYSNYLRDEKNNSDSSIQTKILAFSSFYAYLNDSGIMNKNYASPVLKRLKPTYNKKEGTYLESDEAEKIISVCKNPRERAIMTLFLNNGLRVGTLIGIEISNYKGNEISFRDKGGKIRKIQINDLTKTTIDSYLLYRQRTVERTHTKFTNLFLSDGGKPMATSSIDRTINKLAKKANIINKKISAHSLRRTVATDMHNRGEDILTIKNVLGHAFISTTQLYIKDNQTDANRAINNRVIGLGGVNIK